MAMFSHFGTLVIFDAALMLMNCSPTGQVALPIYKIGNYNFLVKFLFFPNSQ